MDEPHAALPAAGEPVGFEQHIKPLFRRYDRQAMSFAFDLWSYDDVSQHAEAILAQLQAGTMPWRLAPAEDRRLLTLDRRRQTSVKHGRGRGPPTTGLRPPGSGTDGHR